MLELISVLLLGWRKLYVVLRTKNFVAKLIVINVLEDFTNFLHYRHLLQVEIQINGSSRTAIVAMHCDIVVNFLTYIVYLTVKPSARRHSL
jgi:hypothetical protein